MLAVGTRVKFVDNSRYLPRKGPLPGESSYGNCLGKIGVIERIREYPEGDMMIYVRFKDGTLRSMIHWRVKPIEDDMENDPEFEELFV